MIHLSFPLFSVVLQTQQAIIRIVFSITALSRTVEQYHCSLHIYSLHHQWLYQYAIVLEYWQANFENACQPKTTVHTRISFLCWTFYECSQTYNDICIIIVSIIFLHWNHSVDYLIISFHPRPGQLYWILFHCMLVLIFVECHIVGIRSCLAFWWLYYFCIPTSTKWHFPLCYILVNVWWHQCLDLSYYDKFVNGLYLITLICSFLIMCDIEYLFTFIFSVCIFCDILLDIILPISKFKLFIFLFIFKTNLYISDESFNKFLFCRCSVKCGFFSILFKISISNIFIVIIQICH